LKLSFSTDQKVQQRADEAVTNNSQTERLNPARIPTPVKNPSAIDILVIVYTSLLPTVFPLSAGKSVLRPFPGN